MSRSNGFLTGGTTYPLHALVWIPKLYQFALTQMAEAENLRGNTVTGSFISEHNGRVEKKFPGKEQKLVFIQANDQRPKLAL